MLKEAHTEPTVLMQEKIAVLFSGFLPNDVVEMEAVNVMDRSRTEDLLCQVCNDPVWLDEEEHHRGWYECCQWYHLDAPKAKYNTGMCFNVAHWLCVSTFYDEKDEEKWICEDCVPLREDAEPFGVFLASKACAIECEKLIARPDWDDEERLDKLKQAFDSLSDKDARCYREDAEQIKAEAVVERKIRETTIWLPRKNTDRSKAVPAQEPVFQLAQEVRELRAARDELQVKLDTERSERMESEEALEEKVVKKVAELEDTKSQRDKLLMEKLALESMLIDAKSEHSKLRQLKIQRDKAEKNTLALESKLAEATAELRVLKVDASTVAGLPLGELETLEAEAANAMHKLSANQQLVRDAVAKRRADEQYHLHGGAAADGAHAMRPHARLRNVRRAARRLSDLSEEDGLAGARVYLS